MSVNAPPPSPDRARGPGKRFERWWTSERIAEAKGLLAESKTVVEACAKFSQIAGRPVSSFNMAHAFQAAHLASPSSFLPGAITVDVLEEDWKEIMPAGQRLKGNSTLHRKGVIQHQWVKTERDSVDPPDVPKVPEGFSITDVSTNVDAQGQVRTQWTKAKQDEQTRFRKFWDACEEAAKSYEGLAASVPAPSSCNDALMTVYALGDPHIGMLAWARETGEDFDLKIAERDLIRAIDILVDRAPASKRAAFVNVGDFFHSQSDAQTTPHGGNKLDVDSRWSKVLEIGCHVQQRMVDRLLTKHQIVDVVEIPGNHDPQMAVMLALWLRSYYRNEPRVIVHDANNPYVYLRHGKTLIGISHGDGAKLDALPGIMAADRPEDWGTTLFRVWITGHVHHDQEKEFPGCTVRSIRTLATRDFWHHWRGYRSMQSLTSTTYDSEWGEQDRATVGLRLVRAVIGEHAL